MIWVICLVSSAKFRFKSSRFWLIFGLSTMSECRVGRPISVGITAAVPYTIANRFSPIEEYFVVLYAHNTLGNSSAHFPLLCSRFFLIMFRMALFVASAYPLLCGYDTEAKFNLM